MSLDSLDHFINSIVPNQTYIKDKLPFVWVFGSSSPYINLSEILSTRILPEQEELSNKEDKHFLRVNYIKWLISKKDELIEYIHIPELYSQWNQFDKYTNLVDFEVDVVSLSQGTIIFSENVGSYMEIAIFSCFPELHENLLIVVPKKYVQEDCNSFFRLGPIRKIEENQIEDTPNIWALDLDEDKSIGESFSKISTHFLDILTSPKKQQLIDFTNKGHISLLAIDLIDLFPRRNKAFYTSILERFNIDALKDIKKTFELLKMLELITTHRSGNNILYEIRKNFKYKSCIYYTGKNGKFHRASAKIIANSD